jgi:hypothetical protein
LIAPDLASDKSLRLHDVAQGAKRLFFDSYCTFRLKTPRNQTWASTGLLEALPKNGDVPKSPLPLIGSPGAIGRHNLKIDVGFALRVPSAPQSARPRDCWRAYQSFK